jgi:hypothetical protein
MTAAASAANQSLDLKRIADPPVSFRFYASLSELSGRRQPQENRPLTISCHAGPMQPDQPAQSSHHIEVHRILTAHAAADRLLIAPGVDGEIGRAQCHFARLGDDHALGLLAEINIALFRLRHAMRGGDMTEAAAQRATLDDLARAWRRHMPLFQVAEIFPAEGRA